MKALLLTLTACAGTVSPGTPLETRMVDEQSTVATACFLPPEASWSLTLERSSGDCAPELELEMRAQGEAHASFAGGIGYASYAVSEGECLLSFDVSVGEDRIIGWMQWMDGWHGVVSVSRSQYAGAVLGESSCSGLYEFREELP